MLTEKSHGVLVEIGLGKRKITEGSRKTTRISGPETRSIGRHENLKLTGTRGWPLVEENTMRQPMLRTSPAER